MNKDGLFVNNKSRDDLPAELWISITIFAPL